ncbi:MAG: Structural maintenance of chromosomes protein 1 [Chaenotheca gracillima]|nr:MAG: Structural maintenance of chromosomes protein 1 [Chaenotheca gracillima]
MDYGGAMGGYVMMSAPRYARRTSANNPTKLPEPSWTIPNTPSMSPQTSNVSNASRPQRPRQAPQLSNSSSSTTGQTITRYDRKEDMHSSTTSFNTSSSGSAGRGDGSSSAHQSQSPCVMRYGRRYLSDGTLPYPFPCDVPELHRQNLWTTFLVEVFGAPFCSPWMKDKSPKQVLEVACGTALWSSLCHDHLVELGYPNVSFTGLDVAPLAPDLQEQGMDWAFVQHDLRRSPLPFEEDSFDLVFVKDLSFVAPAAAFQNSLMPEYLRILKPGGTLEIWDSDHALRTLLPHPPQSPVIAQKDQQRAKELAMYSVLPSTPGTPPQNQYLQDHNGWIKKALDRRNLMSMPCTAIGSIMIQEAEDLKEQNNRRFAIMLSEVKWEREGVGGAGAAGALSSRRKSVTRQEKGKAVQTEPRTLTPDQLALRRTALLIFVGMIESLEPLLKEASGKNQDEWARWWAGMMEDLLEKKGTSSGECLEVGAWWGQKLQRPIRKDDR